MNSDKDKGQSNHRVWALICLIFLHMPVCSADTIVDASPTFSYIYNHSGLIISILLILLLAILLLLIKSRTLEKTLREKNKVLVRASQTITTYLQVVDKNVLSISLDISGIITNISTCFIQQYHLKKESLVGRPYKILFQKRNSKSLGAFKQAIANKRGWEGELLMIGNDDGPFWADVSLDVVMSEYGDNDPNGFTLILSDITNQKLIRQISETDALTGIYNRYGIDQLLEQELNRHERYHHELVVGMIDLDYFKPVNDNYGHLVGDSVLVTFADTIKNNIRKVDIFGRWGGEEFIIIFPELTINQAFQTCEKLRKKITNIHYPEGVSLTASFGITSSREGDATEDIINRADQALYQAKDSGRNSVKVVT